MIGIRSTRSKRDRTVSSESAVPQAKRQKKLTEWFGGKMTEEETLPVESVLRNEKLSHIPKVSPRKVKDEPTSSVKKEESSSEESDVSDNEGFDSIEERRRKNMEANALFLSSLGIGKVVSQMSETKWKARPLKKKEKLPPAPRRSSLRLQRITPDGAEMPTLPEPEPVQPEHPRKPVGPGHLKDFLWERNLEEHVGPVMDTMTDVSKEKIRKSCLCGKDLDQFVSGLKSMQLQHVVKCTPQRIFSVSFHPASSKMLAVTGDKWGHLAFWDVACGEKGVTTFEPHSRPVNHIICSPHDYSNVYTASYDGTLRMTDLNKGTFREVYSTDEDDDVRLTRFDMLSPHSMIVSQGDGHVAIVDTRKTSPAAASTYHVHDRLIKCVNVHPVDKNYFLTATNGGQVSLWDARNLSKTKCRSIKDLPHSKSVDAAHFSPVNGNSILTTCYDNRLHIYDSSDLTNIKQTWSFAHDNHTGRWLTNFRAEWHPQREDLFVIGSMKRPRQIELFSTRGQIVKVFSDDLTSVCSLNAFHPTLNALVGANSSGRLAAFY